MSTFEISIQQFEQLSDVERFSVSNNGSGKEYANYIRIQRNGVTVYLESDAMEPEDAKFTRDLRWIRDAVLYAYNCGVADAKESA